MWKIDIKYSDGSELTIRGKHKDIPLEVAHKYYKDCVKYRRVITNTYQQYPLKDNEPISLEEKLAELLIKGYKECVE